MRIYQGDGVNWEVPQLGIRRRRCIAHSAVQLS